MFARYFPSVVLLGSGLFGLAWYAWEYGHPKRAYVATWYYEYYLVFALLSAGVICLFFALRPMRHRWCAVSLRQILCLTTMVALLAGTHLFVTQRVPLRMGLWLNRDAFNEMADEALADPASVEDWKPRDVLGYRVMSVEVVGEDVLLRLDGGGHPHERCGFMRIKDFPGDMPALGDPWGYYVSVVRRLQDDWFVVYSHYDSIKTGWS